MLQHDAQQLAKRRHPAEAVGDLGVDLQAVRQPAEGEFALRAGVALQCQPPRRAWTRQRERCRRLRPRVGLAERLRDLPAVVPRQHERGVPHHLRGQAEHPPRGSGDLTFGNVENT